MEAKLSKMDDDTVVEEAKEGIRELIKIKIESNEFDLSDLDEEAKKDWMISLLFDRFREILSGTLEEESEDFLDEFKFLKKYSTALGVKLDSPNCFCDTCSQKKIECIEDWSKKTKKILFEDEFGHGDVGTIGQGRAYRCRNMEGKIYSFLKEHLRVEGISDNLLANPYIQVELIDSIVGIFHRVIMSPGIKTTAAYQAERDFVNQYTFEFGLKSGKSASDLRLERSGTLDWIKFHLNRVISSYLEKKTQSEDEDSGEPMEIDQSSILMASPDSILDHKMISDFQTLIIKHLDRAGMELHHLLPSGMFWKLWDSISKVFCDILFSDEMEDVIEHPMELSFLLEFRKDFGMPVDETSFGCKDTKLRGMKQIRSLFLICTKMLLDKKLPCAKRLLPAQLVHEKINPKNSPSDFEKEGEVAGNSRLGKYRSAVSWKRVGPIHVTKIMAEPMREDQIPSESTGSATPSTDSSMSFTKEMKAALEDTLEKNLNEDQFLMLYNNLATALSVVGCELSQIFSAVLYIPESEVIEKYLPQLKFLRKFSKELALDQGKDGSVHSSDEKKTMDFLEAAICEVRDEWVAKAIDLYPLIVNGHGGAETPFGIDKDEPPKRNRAIHSMVPDLKYLLRCYTEELEDLHFDISKKNVVDLAAYQLRSVLSKTINEIMSVYIKESRELEFCQSFSEKLELYVETYARKTYMDTIQTGYILQRSIAEARKLYLKDRNLSPQMSDGQSTSPWKAISDFWDLLAEN